MPLEELRQSELLIIAQASVSKSIVARLGIDLKWIADSAHQRQHGLE